MSPVVAHLGSHLKARFSTNKYAKRVQKYVDILWKKYHEEGLLKGVVSNCVEIILFSRTMAFAN